MYETILWATDGSEGADAALVEARRIARWAHARILAVHCDQRLTGRAGAWSVFPDEDVRRSRIERQIEALRREGVPIDLTVERSSRGVAESVATAAAERGADLIVCGTRGRGPFAGALGGFTHRILRLAPCPVLVVPTLPARARLGGRSRGAEHQRSVTALTT